MAGTYHVGDAVRITGTFTDADGDAHDPSAVFAEYIGPSDAEATELIYGTDVELVKASTGVYYVDVDADEAGTWHYRFYSTTGGQAAGESEFDVAESAF
jgi:uncharacterized protein YfaS (alpha-2-macroglobulin family)